MKNLQQQNWSSSWPLAWNSPQSCFPLFLHPFRHPFRDAANQAEILGAAKRAEMADVEQTRKIIPLVTCEVSFVRNVCDLVFGVNAPYLHLGVRIDSVKQPIKRNSVGSGNVSLCWTPTLDYHLNHGFIVLKHVQHSNGQRNLTFECTLSI